jgi:hypothetical protein
MVVPYGDPEWTGKNLEKVVLMVFKKHRYALWVAGWMFLPFSLCAQTSEIPKIKSTPICDMESIRLPTATQTWKNEVINCSPPAKSLPVTNLSTAFQARVLVFIIRNSAEWKAFYKPLATPKAPVDFNSKMVIVAEYQGCNDQVSFLSACKDSTQVTVSIVDYQLPAGCDHVTIPGSLTAIAIPTSNSRITWRVDLRK